MATESIGLPFEATSAAAWLVWILPFAAALIMPGIGKFSKRATGYVAVGFALMSAYPLHLCSTCIEATEFTIKLWD